MQGESDPASVLADRMVAQGETPPPGLSDDGCRALGWALKDACYAAWSSAPQRAVQAADALQRLCLSRWPASSASGESPLRGEVTALADWTAGIACLTRGQMNEAAAGFNRAAEGFATLGQDRHAAQTQVPRIMALSMQGKHAEAAECAEQTQRAFVELGDVAAAGKVSLNLGSLHLRRDDFREAARHYRQAVVLFARVGDREHSVMGDIGMADALTALGDFDEATRIYARAAMRARTHGFPVLEAIVEESVAGATRCSECRSILRSRKSNWPTRIWNCACCPRRWRCSTRR